MIRNKIFLLAALAALLLGGATPGQEAVPPGPAREALLLVGVQDYRLPGGSTDPARPAVRQAGRVLQEFRKAGELVLHAATRDPGAAPFAAEVAPEHGEVVLTCPHANPFRETGLLEILRDQGVQQLVICGMDAHLEVEAAVRAAADLGFACVVVSDACHSASLRWRGQTVAGQDLLLGTMLTLRKGYARVQTIDGWLAAH